MNLRLEAKPKSRSLFILLLTLICIGSSAVLPERALAQQRDSSLRVPRLIEQGKRAYLEGHFLIARSLFRKATAADPQNALAHYGYARSAHRLHEYEEAIRAFEKALTLAPKNQQIWQDYLQALTWGGVYKTDSRMLEKARDKGLKALESWPDDVAIHRWVLKAEEMLNEVVPYVARLEALYARFPQAPVLAIHLAELRLRLAQNEKNTQKTDQIRATIKSELAAIENSQNLSARELYKITIGYRLLRENEKFTSAFDALTKTVEGQELAQNIPLPNWPGMMPFFTKRNFTDEELHANLKSINAAKERVPRSWNAPDLNLATLTGLEFDTLAEMARRRSSRADAASPPSARTQIKVGELITLGERLTELDTFAGSNWYAKTSQLLLDLNVRIAEVIRITNTGIKALRERRPGLINPGMPNQEIEEDYITQIARLSVLKGKALQRIGKFSQAESLMRAAIKDDPSAESYSALGAFLLQQRQTVEAYDHLVSALATDLREGSTLEKQTRQTATRAATLLKKSDAALSEDIAERKKQFALEHERSLVGDRVNLPAVNFELKDLKGKVWRLEDLKGSVVVLNYWATWCAPCIAEFPQFQKLVKEYANQSDVIFLAVAVDDDPQQVKTWLQGKDYDFNVLLDQKTAINYKVNSYPTAFILAPDGSIAYRTTGFPGNARYLKEMRLRIDALRSK